MRIRQIVEQTLILEGDQPLERLHVALVHGGVPIDLYLALPPEWATWARADKVAWVKQQVLAHLATQGYGIGGEIVYPDGGQAEQAADNLEALPGWGSWTSDQAAQWIDQNVVDLASAKQALRAMVRAIVFLRDIVIPQ